jgi:hypothetical protein
MAREFKEVAMLRTDLKKYHENWEHIVGKKEEDEKEEDQESREDEE